MLLPYGVNSAGELVYIDQVGRGRLTDVICPYCGGALLARKGQRVAHHFAHAGATCQPSARADDVIALPAYDRFGLNLSGREWEVLQGFHDAIAPSAARNYGWHAPGVGGFSGDTDGGRVLASTGCACSGRPGRFAGRGRAAWL